LSFAFVRPKTYYIPLSVLGYPFVSDPVLLREPAPDKDKDADTLPAVAAAEAAPASAVS